MNILITYASNYLPMKLYTELSSLHNIRLTDKCSNPKVPDLMVSDLSHKTNLNELTQGIDVVIHTGEATNPTNDSDWLNYTTYGTYNLLRSSCESGVARFVYLSSLNILKAYPQEYTVTESWQSRPTTSASDLSFHLGEFICREFARENRLSVVCLRLGEVSSDDDTVSDSALNVYDAVNAVELALDCHPPKDLRWTIQPEPVNWQLYHIQSKSESARFSTKAAEAKIGFQPT